MRNKHCPICEKLLIKHGKTGAGKQRWCCKNCSFTQTRSNDTDAKGLQTFLQWLFYCPNSPHVSRTRTHVQTQSS
ncbi:IS1/IS1595 family N-terminal zinc-binding domain-containing protein [Arcanobacterium phocae]|uniref:IS1/IS1595 family N-terminal zinc-binding domain-containing protein n=1 Tax=Arcanobacterium phocae TaxID=131112 RepID=UPI003F509C89